MTSSDFHQGEATATDLAPIVEGIEAIVEGIDIRVAAAPSSKAQTVT